MVKFFQDTHLWKNSIAIIDVEYDALTVRKNLYMKPFTLD